MKSWKSLNLYNVLPQEFNLVALKVRGCLHEMYKIKEKMNNVESQVDLLSQMKNSDNITNEIYNPTRSNKSSEIKPRKIRLSRLYKFDVNIAKFLQNKDTKLLVKEERIRINKAMESLQKLNANFVGAKDNKLSVSVNLSKNKSSTNLDKLTPTNKNTFRPVSGQKKLKLKITQDQKNKDVNKINVLRELNKSDKNIQKNSLSITKKFFKSNGALPKISLFPPITEKKEEDDKLNSFLKNISENKNESKDEESKSNKTSSSNSNSSDKESEEKVIPLPHPSPKKLMSKRNSVFVGSGSSKLSILNDIKSKKRNSCIGIEQFKMNLNLLGVNEEKNKEEKKKKNEKIDTPKIQNNGISLLFPESYDIKKYFASPIERVKNMYLINCDRKKIILPKIKM